MERSQLNSEQLAGTNADATVYTMHAHETDARIRLAYILPKTTTAPHASNYMTFNVKVGSTTVATATTATVGLTAGEPRAFTISGDPSVGAGDAITLEAIKSGTGPTYSASIVLEMEPVR